MGRVMARSTAHRGVERNARIEVELAAQLVLPFRDRVPRRYVDFGRERLQTGRNGDGQRFVVNQFGPGGSPEVGKRGRALARFAALDLFLHRLIQLLGVDRTRRRGDGRLVPFAPARSQIGPRPELPFPRAVAFA